LPLPLFRHYSHSYYAIIIIGFSAPLRRHAAFAITPLLIADSLRCHAACSMLITPFPRLHLRRHFRHFFFTLSPLTARRLIFEYFIFSFFSSLIFLHSPPFFFHFH
jgi:hypothetical protein